MMSMVVCLDAAKLEGLFLKSEKVTDANPRKTNIRVGFESEAYAPLLKWYHQKET